MTPKTTMLKRSMRKAKQLSLFKDPRKNTKLWWIVKQNVYGGSLDYRKVARPFDSKMLSHAVFKANLAGTFRFTKFEQMVRQVIARTGVRYGIKVLDVAVNHDHIHLLFYTKSREAQTRLLRLISADLGRWYKSIRKNFGLAPKDLWLGRPFTRLVSWGRKSLARVRSYIQRNRREAIGFIEYRPRKHRLNAFLAAWSAQRFSSA